ncbi:phage tail tape measure protein [Streptomyces mirabilis]
MVVSIGVDTSEMVDKVDDGVQETNSKLGNLGKGVAGLAAGAGVAALFTEGLNTGMELTAVNSKLQSQFGLTAKEAETAGHAAGDVYSSGFGESVGEVGDAVGAVTQALKGMGTMTQEQTTQMTEDAMMVADALGVEVGDAATAAGKMISNGLAKDGTEAFDLLTQASKTLPKSMVGDITEVVGEYGQQFKRLGINGADAFGMLSQYVKAGGKDIDQAADVIHEFGRITTENTAQAAGAFKSLGLDSKDMFKRLHKGGKDAESALGDAITAIKGVKDPAKQAQLAVQLFGDMAGEQTDALFAMNPATAAAASGMDKAGGAAAKATESMSASQGLEVIWRTMATTIGEQLQPVLTWLGQFMTDHPAIIKGVAAVVLVLAVALGIATIATWAMNSALLANPITWIILGVVALIAIIVLMVTHWDQVKAALLGAWKAIVSGLSSGWRWLVNNVFNPIGRFFTQTIPGWAGRMAGWVQDKWDGLIGWFRKIPGRISSALSGAFDGLKGAFRGAVNWVIGKWNNLSFSIGGGSFMGVDIPHVTLGTPNIPYLATGGVTTGPTLAMIGEGRENEAVLPLSKLNGMLNAARVQGVNSQGSGARVVIDVTGADGDMKKMIRRMVRVDGRGSVQTAFGG